MTGHVIVAVIGHRITSVAVILHRITSAQCDRSRDGCCDRLQDYMCTLSREGSLQAATRVCERVFEENSHVCTDLCLHSPLDIHARDGCCCVSTRPRDTAGALVCVFSCCGRAQAQHTFEGETGKITCSALQRLKSIVVWKSFACTTGHPCTWCCLLCWTLSRQTNVRTSNKKRRAQFSHVCDLGGIQKRVSFFILV